MKVLKNRLHIMLLTIVCILALGIFHADAAQTLNSSVNLTGATSSSLTFEVTYKNAIRPIGATFDGVAIEGFDILHNVNYTVSDLQPNTTHYFCIYKDLYNCELGTTLSETQTSSEKIVDFFWQYIFFIVALLCIIAGIRVPFVALAGSGFACIGIISVITISFWAGFIFMVVFCAGLFVAFKPGD